MWIIFFMGLGVVVMVILGISVLAAMGDSRPTSDNGTPEAKQQAS